MSILRSKIMRSRMSHGATEPSKQAASKAGMGHLFAQADQLGVFWQQNRTFEPDLCCYRYVEGLNTNDPEGLILLYYWQPTYWECSSHKQRELGRPVCSLSFPGETRVSSGGAWKFIPEAEFQVQLAHTLAYLRDRNRPMAGRHR